MTSEGTHMPEVPIRETRRSRRTFALAGAVMLPLGLLLLSLPAGAAAAEGQHAHLAGTARAAAGGLAPADNVAAGRSRKTVRGPHMLDPKTTNYSNGKPGYFRQRSTVTVSQTRDMVNQSVRVSWTGFTPSNMEGASGRYYDERQMTYPVMIVECRGLRPTRVSQCFAANVALDELGFGSNAVYTFTSPRGTGVANIQVETLVQNSRLHCDGTHACSLAVVPAQGGLPGHCNDHSSDLPFFGDIGEAAGENSFGGNSAACAWAKRITIPLHFAPVQVCPRILNANLRIAGSPLMLPAMLRWDPGLCRQSNPLTVEYNGSVGEPTAVDELKQGQADIALTTRPGPAVSGSQHYAYAPVAVTAAAFVYWFDNPSTGLPYTDIKLTPRVAAKLLTLSYNPQAVRCPATSGAPPCDKTVAGNPFDLFVDKDFHRSNTGVREPLTAWGQPMAYVPFLLGGPNDMGYETTRWIAADPAAKSFLAGKPDPWKMHVNDSYKHEHYPTDVFVGLDHNLYLQQAYNPLPTLAIVTTDFLSNQPPGNNALDPNTPTNGGCPPSSKKCSGYRPLPIEYPGQRDLFGLTDEADAADFLFPTAAVRNHAGRFVRPTTASMAAALRSAVPGKSGTEQVSMTTKNPSAYPLTMVVYAMVPTSGVSRSKAAAIARWLNFAADPGQTRGVLPGQLPVGYLPLPASMRARTHEIAARVAQQAGNQGGTAPTGNPTPTGAGNSPSAPASASAGATTSASPSLSLPAAQPQVSLAAVKDPATSGITRYALPVVLIAGAVMTLGGAWSLLLGGPGPAMAARLRRVLAAAGKRTGIRPRTPRR
jgi:hypothetical protein